MTDSNSPTFYSATAVPHPKRPRLMYDVDTGVCVIGAGFAGLWTARALAKRGYDVVLLDSRRIGDQASGRNGGFVSAGFSERLPAIVERVGIDDARSLYKLSRDGVEAVRSAVAGDDMPGVSPAPGRLHVRRFDDEDGIRREADLLATVFNHEMSVWSKERVRETLATRRYFQALHDGEAFCIHPLNLALGLAGEIEALGVQIFEETKVMDADLGGVRKVIVTSAGKVRAHQVVFCTSASIGDAFPELERTILPVATHVCVTAPIGDALQEIIRFPGGISDTRRANDYYRVVDGRLLWGGRITTRVEPPKQLKRKLLGDIASVYPQLKSAVIEHAWTGVMGYAIHKMPQIGLLRPGVWINTAFGGHGLNASAMGAELIASAISEHDDRWRLFIPFGVVWAGGSIGRRTTQLVYWSMQLRDRWEERRSMTLERRAERKALRQEKARIRAAERGVREREKAEQAAKVAALSAAAKAGAAAVVGQAVEETKQAVNEKHASS